MLLTKIILIFLHASFAYIMLWLLRFKFLCGWEYLCSVYLFVLPSTHSPALIFALLCATILNSMFK